MSARQKLMIGNKIIDLFLRKIACSDYKSVLLKDITISNYSENNPLLANVKIQS